MSHTMSHIMSHSSTGQSQTSIEVQRNRKQTTKFKEFLFELKLICYSKK